MAKKKDKLATLESIETANHDKGYWFCLYTEGDDDYVEFTIKQLVKDELDRFENAEKTVMEHSDDELLVTKEQFIDELIYDLISLKHEERSIHYHRKRLNGQNPSQENQS